MYNFKHTPLLTLSKRLNEIEQQKKMLELEEKGILLELKNRLGIDLKSSESPTKVKK